MICDATPGMIYTFTAESAYKYDTARDRWTKLSPPSLHYTPDIYLGAGFAVCDVDAIHYFGGYGPFGRTGAHRAYHVTTDTWSDPAGMPAAVDSDVQGATAAYDGKISVVTATATATVYAYDTATDTWSGRLSTAPVPVDGEAYAQAGRYLYLAGGNTGPRQPTRTVQRLDLVTAEWSTGPELPAALFRGELVSTDTALYFLGGKRVRCV